MHVLHEHTAIYWTVVICILYFKRLNDGFFISDGAITRLASLQISLISSHVTRYTVSYQCIVYAKSEPIHYIFFKSCLSYFINMNHFLNFQVEISSLIHLLLNDNTTMSVLWIRRLCCSSTKINTHLLFSIYVRGI